MPSKIYADVARVLINTVDIIKSKHTVKVCSDARKARSIQDIKGQPSTKD